MGFDTRDTALELARRLADPLARLKRINRHAWDQADRALDSVCLLLSEGRGRVGADRLHFFTSAYASALELGTALDLVEARGQMRFDADVRQLDRVRAMTWRLTHPR